MKVVRAKFKCESITSHQPSAPGVPGPKTVKLRAVYNSEENKDWAKYTPNGVVELTIDNPPASDLFEPGRDYFLAFTRADEKE